MNIFKALSVAYDLFKGVDDNRYYDSLLNYGTSFSFDAYDQEKAISKGYANNADLYSIVRKITTSASSIELQLFNYLPNGEKELITDGELYDLTTQPNRLQTFPEYLEEALLYLLLNGNTYTLGTKSLGFGDAFREINVLSAPYVDIITGDRFEPIKGYQYNDIKTQSFSFDEVMHVKYPNPKGNATDRLYGLSPLQAGNKALQSSNNTYEANANIITNHGTSGILTSDSERSMTKEEGLAVQEAWDNKQRNPAKFGRTLTTSAKLRFLQMGMSPSDLKLLENGTMTMRSLCNIYQVPSQLFNDVAGTTFNNMDAAKKSLYTEAVIPNMNLFLTNFNNWFIDSWSKKEGKDYSLEMNLESVPVLQDDQKSEAEKDKLVADTIINILNSPTSNETKVQVLVYSIGMSEDEATLIVGNENN